MGCVSILDDLAERGPTDDMRSASDDASASTDRSGTATDRLPTSGSPDTLPESESLMSPSCLSYDVKSKAEADRRFDRNHVEITDLKADILLPRIKNDDYVIDVKRLVTSTLPMFTSAPRSDVSSRSPMSRNLDCTASTDNNTSMIGTSNPSDSPLANDVPTSSEPSSPGPRVNAIADN